MKEYLEKNKNTLSAAIAGLPEHSAPEMVWKELAISLDRQEELHKALNRLPQHQAPAAVWDNIEQSLDAPAVRPRPLLHRILQRSRLRIAAAVLFGIALSTWWITHAGGPAKTTVAYTEEVQAGAVFTADWEDEAAQIATVLARVERSPIADPQVVGRLKLEYDELTDARSEVEAIMKRYGKDEDLLKEIARIERERSQVIKELATWI